MARTPQQKNGNHQPARLKLIEAITTPLGFFVLALLIVESFLAIVLLRAELAPADKVTFVLWGIGLFILVVLVVSAFVWWRPSNLTFDKDAHLLDRGKTPYGSEKQTVKAEDLFSSNKKEETK